ncbi:MAG: hypothetical protein R3194_02645 [Limnobacter sp.]|nr:hypothetical protein [Limnobacter sp.]
MSVFLLVGLSSLGVVSVGQHYWEMGRIQKIADLSALAAARELHSGPPFNLANAVATQNGLQEGESVNFTCLINNGVDPAFATEDCSVANAVQTSIARRVNPMFLIGATDILAQATAAQAPAIAGSIQSSLAIASLNGLNVTLLGGGTLIDTAFRMNVLDLASSLGLTRISDLETTTVSAVAAFDAALDAAGVSQLDILSPNVTAFNDLLSTAPDVVIGDILNLSLGEQLQGDLTIRLNDFARALGLNSMVGQAIAVTDPGVTLALLEAEPLTPVYQAVGIRNVTVQVQEPPQIFVGRKVPGGGNIVEVSTSQLQVDLDLAIGGGSGLLQSLSNAVLLGVNTQFTIGLRLTGVGGSAVVSDLTCELPEENNTITTQVTSQLASLEICPCDPEDNPTDLLTVEVLSITNPSALNGILGPVLSLLGINAFEDVRIQLLKGSTTDLGDPAAVDVTGTPSNVVFTGVNFPYTHSVPVDLGGALPNLFGPLDYDVVISAGTQDSLILDIVNPNQLLNAVTAALGPALGQVGDVLDDVLLAAGVELNSVELRIDHVDCEGVVLTQ